MTFAISRRGLSSQSRKELQSAISFTCHPKIPHPTSLTSIVPQNTSGDRRAFVTRRGQDRYNEVWPFCQTSVSDLQVRPRGALPHLVSGDTNSRERVAWSRNSNGIAYCPFHPYLLPVHLNCTGSTPLPGASRRTWGTSDL